MPYYDSYYYNIKSSAAFRGCFSLTLCCYCHTRSLLCISIDTTYSQMYISVNNHIKVPFSITYSFKMM